MSRKRASKPKSETGERQVGLNERETQHFPGSGHIRNIINTEMRSDGFTCKQCGKCCREHTIYLTEEDYYRWLLEEREDILEWVDPIYLDEDNDIAIYDFPIDPETGEEVEGACPFLKRLQGQNIYICRIHDTKPEICVAFPHNRKHAEEFGCPGYDS
jgi:Fe-S-cluster containining protein